MQKKIIPANLAALYFPQKFFLLNVFFINGYSYSHVILMINK